MYKWWECKCDCRIWSWRWMSVNYMHLWHCHIQFEWWVVCYAVGIVIYFMIRWSVLFKLQFSLLNSHFVVYVFHPPDFQHRWLCVVWCTGRRHAFLFSVTTAPNSLCRGPVSLFIRRRWKNSPFGSGLQPGMQQINSILGRTATWSTFRHWCDRKASRQCVSGLFQTAGFRCFTRRLE